MRLYVRFLRGWGWKTAGFEYRCDPVPCTGKPRWIFKNWYKKPKTTQERRWNEAHKEYIRNKRSPANLPIDWDDRPRGDVRGRKCWKNQKIRKQWMKNI